MKKPPINNELQSWKNAVWDFLLDHCDVQEKGRLFVKFHTDGRADFEKRVWVRSAWNYHRNDPIEKEVDHLSRRHAYWEKKLEARERFLKNLARGQRVAFWRKLLFYLGIDPA